MTGRTGTTHPDTRTLMFEREQWNRLYHEQGRRIVFLEESVGGLLALVERVGQGLHPAAPEVVRARKLLGRAG